MVRVLDPHVGEGDLSTHNGQVQLFRESELRAVVPALILRLGLAELPIQFFLQVVVELNADDLPTVALDLTSGLLIQTVERGVVVGFLGLYETGVNRLVLWH